MKQRELARLHVLNNILEYQTPIVQAAEILGMSERHTRRLLNAYRKDEPPPWPMATGADDPTTLSRSPNPQKW